MGQANRLYFFSSHSVQDRLSPLPAQSGRDSLLLFRKQATLCPRT